MLRLLACKGFRPKPGPARQGQNKAARFDRPSIGE